MTQTITEEIHLVNIISLAEDKLQSNFKSIINKLKHHEQKFNEQQSSLISNEKKILNIIQKNQIKNGGEINNLTHKLEKCFELIQSLTQKVTEQSKHVIITQKQTQKINKDILDMGIILEEKIGQSRNDYQIMDEKLIKMQADIYKAYEEILKKQDSTQILKICKDVQNAKQKLQKNEKQCKHLEHKVEKIEILNQKSQRNQSKKQVEIMKQIDEKIKKQIKNIQKSLPTFSTLPRYSNNNYSNSNESSNDNSPNKRLQLEISQQTKQRSLNKLQKQQESKGQNQTKRIRLPSQQVSLNKQNSQQERNSSITMRNNLQKLAISKINQKLHSFQGKFKQIQESLRTVVQNKKKSLKPQNDQQIKQKINEIKPQLIKLWAKCDTLDDRIVFNERRIQEKAKLINNLLETQKQNGVGKLDEKFKLFQTQIYTSLKQLKTKVEAKVNCQDYEKQTMMLDQRLKQIFELIYSKSDKLQVKKALLFLQSKIKQIILVISEDEQNQKDALLTKKQLKCMSCDKDVDKLGKFVSTAGRGNWDALPMKDHSPQLLGKFGMTGFGSLSKKLKKLEGKELPVLKQKKSVLQPIVNTTAQTNEAQ